MARAADGGRLPARGASWPDLRPSATALHCPPPIGRRRTSCQEPGARASQRTWSDYRPRLRPMISFMISVVPPNIDIGRPDKINFVFDRKIRLRGKNPTPGTFRTQVITSGACPYLYLYYKKTQVKQYLKEGRALRTETTLNQPRDFGIGKELTNLAAMAEVGYAANRRLLDAECISHDPAAGAAALEAITSPVISTTCTRIPGMRFPDPRVHALLGACCAVALRSAGFTSRDLRHYLGPLRVHATQAGQPARDVHGRGSAVEDVLLIIRSPSSPTCALS